MALDTLPAREQRIEIAIRNSTYMRTKTVPIRGEMPMVLVVCNEDQRAAEAVRFTEVGYDSDSGDFRGLG